MLNQAERARLTDLQDQMIELLVRRDAARERGDETRADTLQNEIDQLGDECDRVRHEHDGQD